MSEESCGVKVFVRFRPVNKREQSEGDGDSSISITGDEIAIQIKGKANENSFRFDKVFHGGSVKQEDVYTNIAQDAIQDVLNGFNATVFAYGQTGAGKSFTMFGGGSDDLAGIIPRASKHIFDHIASATEAREWSVKASFLEIYREQLRDLLNPSSAKLQIREQKKKIWVENLSEEYVATPEDVMDLISAGEKLRATSSTAMNETSSRSHSVFVLRVESKPATPDGAAARSAVLNLIDLAGSERVGKTGATGKTLQEAQKINQSLSALGNVISALSSDKVAEHVPYRDSQLTRLLQESLGGNCKTRLIVACSPHHFNIEETLSSLRFGQRAKTLKNKIHKNEERSVEELKALIKALRAEIEEWKTYANKLKSGQVGAEAPKGGVVVADIVEAKRRDDALEAELERAREAAATAQQQMQELAAELESVVAQREAALAAANAAQTQIDSDRRAHLVQEQHFSSQVEALQMQLRLANASGGDSSSSSSSSKSDSSAQFVAELTTVTEKLNDAKAKLVESSEERRIMLKQHEDALQLEKAKREQMESEMAALQDKIRQLEAWRDSQETRKARLFRPLKSGTKGPPQAFAEKLDHTELRKGLRSVSAEKKLW